MIALGISNNNEWSAKGLKVSGEAILSAGDAFQKGLKQIIDRSGQSTAGIHMALNRHQIVSNHQDVPDWFKQEHDLSERAEATYIDSIENQRSAFSL